MRYKKIDGGEKMKTFIKPMLAKPTDLEPFSDPDWLFEIKWDGYRAIAEIRKHTRKLYSRNGLSFAKAYSKIYEALGLIADQAVLDGEIVVFDINNKPSFQKLQNYTPGSGDLICYYVFDCLEKNGEDLSNLPLLNRKSILRKLLPENNYVRYCDHVEKNGIGFFEAIKKEGLEGMIAKRASSRYAKGKRTPDWLKIRNIKSEEAVIIGYTSPKGSREGFGSLLLAQYRKKKLTYIGNVGTGFNTKLLSELSKKFKAISRKTSPLDVPVKPPPDTTWVDPVYVCNIKFTEKTSQGMLRHPVFQGLRIDKKPREVKADHDV